MTLLTLLFPAALQRQLFEYALNTLWQLPLLAASAWLLIRLCRPSPSAQHILWIGTLGLAVVLPLRGTRNLTPTVPAALSAPSEPSLTSPALLVSESALSTVSDHAASTQSASQPTLGDTIDRTLAAMPAAILNASECLPAIRIHAFRLGDRTLAWIIRLYALAFAFHLLRLLVAWIASRRLIAAARAASDLGPDFPIPDPELLQACADRLRITVPEIRYLHLGSGPTQSPLVAGIIRPVLLLPEALAGDYELIAILLHEFAHIRRRDALANAVYRVLSLPIAWHPVTPLLHARIGQTREMICDAIAAQASGSSTAYAKTLLSLARTLRDGSSPNLATVGLFTHSPYIRNPLEERIMRLIAPQSSAALPYRLARIATGSALMLAAALTASTFHLQAAQAAAATPRPLITLLCPQLPPVAQSTSSTPSAPSAAPLLPASPPDPRHNVTRAAAAAPQAPPAPPVPPIAPSSPAPQVLQAPQAPQAPPAPPAPPAPQVSPAPPAPPAPAPAPAPGPHARIIINGVQRELTPAERARLEKQLGNINIQVRGLMNQHFVDEKQLAVQLKSLNIPELDRQMADLRKQLDSPEFQQQIADAQNLAVDHAMNSPALRAQLDRAAAQLKAAQEEMAHEHIRIDSARMQQQLNAANDAIARAHIRANIHIDSAQIQKQLEAARRQLETARKQIEDEVPHQ